MKGKVFAWLKGLSTAGKVGLAACAIAVVGIAVAGADNKTISYKTITENQKIAFSTVYQEDENLLVNQTKVITPGADGEKKVTYKVTYQGTDEIKREKAKPDEVIKPAVNALVAKGVKEVTTETTTEVVPYTSTTKSDATLTKETRKTVTAGANGVRTLTFEITKIRGKEVSRVQVKSEVTTQPTTEVVAVGTKSSVSSSSPSSCDHNYSGGCVPIASDVDCGGGSGNGPAYFYGTATVVGSDIYGLDRDGDGIACE